MAMQLPAVSLFTAPQTLAPTTLSEAEKQQIIDYLTRQPIPGSLADDISTLLLSREFTAEQAGRVKYEILMHHQALVQKLLPLETKIDRLWLLHQADIKTQLNPSINEVFRVLTEHWAERNWIMKKDEILAARRESEMQHAPHQSALGA